MAQEEADYSSSSSDSEDEFQKDQMSNTNVRRRTYLVTYSQADFELFPTRKSFGDMIQKYFDQGDAKAKTAYWACCLEPHKKRRHGYHYHLSLKLTDVKKWAAVKNNITEKEGIVVNFSDKHSFYIAAYKYTTKEDKFVYHSEGHPNLKDIASLRTKRCTLAYR